MGCSGLFTRPGVHYGLQAYTPGPETLAGAVPRAADFRSCDQPPVDVPCRITITPDLPGQTNVFRQDGLSPMTGACIRVSSGRARPEPVHPGEVGGMFYKIR
jgi:hypothetical protein